MVHPLGEFHPKTGGLSVSLFHSHRTKHKTREPNHITSGEAITQQCYATTPLSVENGALSHVVIGPAATALQSSSIWACLCNTRTA